jgi:hypothetical protein
MNKPYYGHWPRTCKEKPRKIKKAKAPVKKQQPLPPLKGERFMSKRNEGERGTKKRKADCQKEGEQKEAVMAIFRIRFCSHNLDESSLVFVIQPYRHGYFPCRPSFFQTGYSFVFAIVYGHP